MKSTTSLLALPALLLSLVSAAPTPDSHPHKRALTTSGSSINGQTFDIIIVGGGLSGSVLGRRLSDGDTTKKILIIEAGGDESSNPGVYDASQYQSTFGSSIDWAYQTTPQLSGGGGRKSTTMRSGKALGGSTTINGLAWTKPHTFQLDGLQNVGNQGVNWNSLQGYMQKAETFTPPTSNQVSNGMSFTSSCHGTNGPIGVQYDPNSTPANLEKQFNTTVQNLGGRYATDLTCGNPAVLAPPYNTRSGNTRIDAYRGYLYNRNPAGLTILTNAQVGKVLFNTSTSTPTASGVEFRDSSGTTYTAKASLEVILSAGSIKTPVILQQSGIGPTAVLQRAGVQQLVNLPVGQGLVDQVTSTTNWQFSGQRGGGQPILFPRFTDLFTSSEQTTMRNLLNNNIAAYAQDAVNNGASSNATALRVQLELQRDWIFNQGAAIAESFDYSYNNVLGYDSWGLLPFWRGSINITNNQPYSNSFNIDPRYFTNQFDRLVQGAIVRYTRTVSTSNPLKNNVPSESTPGTGSVPNGGTLEQWAAWAQANYRSNWHPIATASMMSRALGGSVDSNHKVYGTNKLRVIDGSNLPFQVSSHLMSVIYGLTERAADILNTAYPQGSGTGNGNTTPPPSGNGRQVHPNGDNSKCMEVNSDTPSNGTPVTINNCASGSRRQSWVFVSGTTSVKLAGTNYCLDAGSNPGNGIKMKVWTCYDNLPAQTWYYTNDLRIAVKDQGQCLDLTDGSKTNGNQLQTWSCQSGNNNQVWTV